MAEIIVLNRYNPEIKKIYTDTLSFDVKVETTTSFSNYKWELTATLNGNRVGSSTSPDTTNNYYTFYDFKLKNLNPGAENEIRLSLTLTGTAEDGSTIKENDSTTINFYTRPKNWSGWDDLEKDKYINDYLTVNLWNEMIEQLAKTRSWAEQYNYYNNDSINNNKCQKDDLLSAALMNNVYALLLNKNNIIFNPSTSSFTGGYTMDIKAEHFTAIRDAINVEEKEL